MTKTYLQNYLSEKFVWNIEKFWQFAQMKGFGNNRRKNIFNADEDYYKIREISKQGTSVG